MVVMLVEAVVKNKGNDDFLKLITCFYFARDSISVTFLPWSQPTKLQNILTSKMLFSSKAAVTFWSQQRILIFINCHGTRFCKNCVFKKTPL